MVSLIVSIAALVVSAVAVWYARATAQASRRSAAAAEDSATSSQELARISQAEEQRNRVRWEFVHFRKQAYVLRNTGTDTAYHVRVEVPGVAQDGPQTVEQFPPDHEQKFLVGLTMQNTGEAVHITWHLDPQQEDPAQDQRIVVG